MITSLKNPQIRNIIQLNQKAKERRVQKLFTAEGRKMFLEAPADWVEKVYVSETIEKDEELMARVQRFPMETVSDTVFRQMCDTQTPQGILTVLRSPSYDMEDLLRKKNPLLMVLEDLQDPGNAGTILRTGEGAGVSGIFLTRTCVDITNPKVIRGTMGSIYRVPFFYVEDVPSLKEMLKGRGIRFFAAHLQGRNQYYEESYQGGSAFLIGNEGKGLTEEAAEAADCLIRIPMEGQVESLNAAMAAGILMYEAARQRRTGKCQEGYYGVCNGTDSMAGTGRCPSGDRGGHRRADDDLVRGRSACGRGCFLAGSRGDRAVDTFPGGIAGASDLHQAGGGEIYEP